MFKRKSLNKTKLTEEVLEKVKSGSARDFMLVYNTLQKGLFLFSLQYLRDPDLAEDVTQTVFMKLWETRERINPSMSFKAYLYRITRNEIMDQLKTITKAEKAKAGLTHAVNGLVIPAVDYDYESQEYETILEEAIDLLPPQRQKVFRLCRQDGLTYQETANQLGISYYTVKEHMTLAIKSIKNYLSQHTDFAVFLFCIYNSI